MRKKSFALYALGSPTKIMENYKFEVLLDMIFAAKSNLPLNKPFHLFGAGHPFMFSLAVASGCDMFDSAAYAIYARNGRYLTDSGTARLDSMNYFPCSCPVCIKYAPKELREMSDPERIGLLSKHNLYTCFEEIRRIKEAIYEERLWELIEIRAKSHPSLSRALYCLRKYGDILEKNTSSTKKFGIFFSGHQSSFRPEVVRYWNRIVDKYNPPIYHNSILLVPAPKNRPYNRNRVFNSLKKDMKRIKDLHICTYSSPYGLIPVEINDMFPLSQTEISNACNAETKEAALKIVMNYLKRNDYKKIILHADEKFWDRKKLDEIRNICDMKKMDFILSYHGKGVWEREALEKLQKILEKLH